MRKAQQKENIELQEVFSTGMGNTPENEWQYLNQEVDPISVFRKIYKGEYLLAMVPGMTEFSEEERDADIRSLSGELEVTGDIMALADFSILGNGFWDYLPAFFTEKSIPSTLLTVRSDVEALSRFPALIIPSGGLMGLSGSATFRAKLEAYVQGGGILIIFTQQHGRDFSVLPGGEVNGFGWAEDQCCQFRSSAIVSFQPFFSAMSSITPDLNVDGYFTRFPADAQVLLRRTANDQPCMIKYPFGNGTVIASTLYADWAYANHQMTADEKRLLSDLFTWAGTGAGDWDAAQIKAPGEDISLDLSVTNPTGTEARSILYQVIGPDGSKLFEETRDLIVPAGGTVDSNFQYTLPFGKNGIYTLNYELKDASGATIFSRPGAAVFSSTNLANTKDSFGYQGATVTFSIQADDDQFFPGATAHFTIMIFNQSGEDKNIRVHHWLPHFGGTDGTVDLAVPAGDTVGYPYEFTFPNSLGTHNLWADFTDLDTGKYLGRAYKTSQILSARFDMTAAMAKQTYNEGEEAEVSGQITNRSGKNVDISIEITVMDRDFNTVYTGQIASQNIANGQAKPWSHKFTVPSLTLTGTLQVMARAKSDFGVAGGTATSFFYNAGNGTLQGSILSAGDGTPVPDALFEFHSLSNPAVYNTAAAGGTFSMQMPGDVYQIYATAPGYYRTVGKATVHSGETVPVSLFTLPTGEGTISGAARLSGEVVSLFTEQPLSGATISLTGSFGTLETAAGTLGDFSFSLIPGDYTLSASYNGSALITNVPFTMTPGNNVVQDLYIKGSDISGTVKNLVTGEGIRGATVEVSGGLMSLTTDENGKYTTVLPQGMITLKTTKEGFADVTTYLYVNARQTNAPDIYLTANTQTTELSVEVRDMVTGQPMAGALVAEPNAVLSGGSSPDTSIYIDNRLAVYRNGRLVHDVYSASGANVGVLYLYLQKGDELSFIATDMGGNKKISEVWLHNLATDEMAKISDAVDTSSGFSGNETTLESRFLSANHTVSWDMTGQSAITDSAGVGEIPVAPGIKKVFVWADGFLPRLAYIYVEQDRPVSHTVPLDNRWVQAAVTVKDLATDAPIQGASVCVPNMVLTGSEDPNSAVSVDNRILVSVNGVLMHDRYNGAGGSVGQIFLRLAAGDTLAITCLDKGGSKALSALWLYNLHTGQKIKLTDGVPSADSGFSHSNASPEKFFFNESFEIPENSLLNQASSELVQTDTLGRAELKVYPTASTGTIFYQRIICQKEGYRPDALYYTMFDKERTQYLETNRAPIAGKVMDLVTGDPIAGAQVVLNAGNDADVFTVATDANGLFNADLSVNAPELKPVDITKDDYGAVRDYFYVANLPLADPVNRTGNYKEFYLQKTGPGDSDAFQISGTVLDLSNDSGVAGATITFTGNSDQSIHTVLTGDGGIWNATLPPQFYTVAITQAGYTGLTSGMYVTERFPGQNFYLKPSAYTPPSNQGQFQVTVLDLITGAPIPGVTVDLDGPGRFTTSAAGTYTWTASSGNYRFACWKSDAYYIVDVSPWITVYPGKTIQVPVYMTPSRGTIEVVALDRMTQNPIQGMRVDLVGTDWHTADADGMTSWTANVQTWQMHFQLTGYYEINLSPWVRLYPGRTVRMPVANTPSRGSLTVYAYNRISKAAIQSMNVDLVGDGWHATGSDGNTSPWTNSAADWRLHFSMSGSYYDLNFYPWVRLFSGRSVDLPVYVPPSKGTLTVHMFDLITGDPSASHTVDLISRGRYNAAADGTYSWTTDVGNYEFECYKDGYNTLRTNPWMTIYSGWTTHVPVYAKPSRGNFIYTAKDVVTGNPIQGFEVDFVGIGWHSTGADGSTSSWNGSVGNWHVHSKKTGYQELDYNPWPTLFPGRTTTVEVCEWPSPMPGGALAGKVADLATGAVLANAIVKIDGSVVTISGDGTYQKNISSGLHTVSGQADGYSSVSFQVYGVEGKTLSKDILFSKAGGAAGTLSVLARNAVTGTPVSGASVELVSTAGTQAFTGTTAADGSVSFSPESGTYALTILADGYVEYRQNLSVPADQSASHIANLSPLGQEPVKKPAAFAVTNRSSDTLNLIPGGDTTYTITIQNTGDEFGTLDMPFSVPGIFEETQTIFLDPNESETVSFQFTVPEDLDERSDVAWFEVGDTKFEIPFDVPGAKVSVEAHLDKPYYAEGENAGLTLIVTSECGFDIRGELRVQLSDFVETRALNLSAGQTATENFQVPVAFDGTKLLFGVYQASGRSIYLDSYYIRNIADVVRISSDRQKYALSEPIALTITADEPCAITFTTPKGWAELTPNPMTLAQGDTIVAWSVPAEEKTGTHSLDYVFDFAGGQVAGSFPVDVEGYEVLIKEISVTGDSFANTDTVPVEMIVEASRDMTATIQVLVYDAGNGLLGQVENSCQLVAGRNVVSFSVPVTSNQGGMFSLAYAIWVDLAGHSPVLMTSGNQYFDVLDASPPHVLFTTPVDGTVDVAANTAVLVTFDEAMDKQATQAAFSISPNVEGSYVWLDNTLSFTPTAVLANGVAYTVHIATTAADTSGNALAAIYSFAFTTIVADWDQDEMPDSWEEDNDLNPRDPADAALDPDSDTLTNLQEFQRSTNPWKRDTDGDGYWDGLETSLGTNPLDKEDHPNVEGDYNGDGNADLADVIFCLEIIAGIQIPSPAVVSNDVDGDGAIGMAEALYSIEKLVGLRD